MKVAVASQGPDWNGRVAPRFGRARYFLIVETASGEFTVGDNSGNLNTTHTAGMQAAGAIVSMGVGAVITGGIGPKAFGTLQAGNVAVYTVAPESVEGTIKEFKAGRLQPTQKANVQEHGK